MGRVARPLLALIVLIAPSCSPQKKPSEAARRQNVGQQSDLKMLDMHIQSFSDCKLAWDVKAPVGETFTNSNVMRLTHMKSTFYEDGQRSGQVESELALLATAAAPLPVNGIALQQEGDVYLSTDVVMVSTDGTKVYTDWARYSRKDDLITSSAPVRVVREDSITNGIGMEARPDMSDLKIFHQTLLIPGTDDQK